MDKKTDKYGVSVIDARYRQLSMQLFGDPRVQTSKCYQGPLVDLSQKCAVKVPRTPQVTPLTHRQKVPDQRCLICYSSINSLETNQSWGDFSELLRILHVPVSSPNGNKSFNLAVKQFKSGGTAGYLCDNCNAACGKLVEVHRQMKILEQEVKVFQAKFLNVIKLSKAMAEKENVETLSSNLTLDRLRTCLIGGKGKWEAIKEEWMGYVNFDKNTNENSASGPCPVENTVKIKSDLNVNCVESEMNSGVDKDNTFFDDDNVSNLPSCISDDDEDNHKKSTKEAAQDQVDNLEKKVETGNQIVKPYKKRKPRPGRIYSMTPDAIRYRALRAKYAHLSDKQMQAYLKTLPKVDRKGKPDPKLAIEDLKQSKSNASHIKWRKTYGKTMSMTAYREMRRKELIEVQKVKDDKVGSAPGRSNIGKGGVKIKWEEKGDGKMMYSGVEVRSNEDGTFSCILCENNGVAVKPVKTKTRMSCHIKRIHFARTNGHACDKCDAKFFYHHQLAQHILGKHVGLQCEICGISFPYRSSLFFHNRVKHQGIKPHVCEHCGKGFATRKDMTIHVRRHTGERPFVCHVCAKTFVEKQSMKKHIQKHHPGEPFEEPVKQDIRI